MSRYAGFKAAVFVLLAGNAVVYVRAGTASEALDSTAWFVLLVLFQAETGFRAALRHPRARLMIRAVRLLAALAIVAAAAGYLRDGAWLDAFNASLWTAVVALLEYEVQRPQSVAAHAARFAVISAALYGGLAIAVLAWAWQGEWFDAYDALLWIIAFATIELDMLSGDRKPPPRRSGEGPVELGEKV